MDKPTRKKKGLSAFSFIPDRPGVFWGTALIAAAFLAFGLFNIRPSQTVCSAVRLWICEYTGWLFVLVVNLVLFYILFLFFSRFGRLRIGGADQVPTFSLTAWFSMIFCAGMGIALVFYGVAEPLYHFVSPPPGGPTPESTEAAEFAMAVTFFHWGLHGWALYALTGLGMAFFAFSRGLPLRLSSVFYPLIGERVHGPAGMAIDIFTCTAILFGLATSLSMAGSQINAGLNYLLGIPVADLTTVIVILCVTACVIVSVISGLYSGIRRLSLITLAAALVVMAFVFITGPSLFITDAVSQNLGAYLDRFWELSLSTETYTMTRWQHNWTIFYWAWWITWAPFVGMFIARISKGRTIREFLTGVLLAPSALIFLWFTVMGGTALHHEMVGAGGLSAAVSDHFSTIIYTFFETLPLSALTSMAAMVLAVLFFITSANSGTLVITIIAAGGDPGPPNAQRAFWALLQAAVAMVMLLCGGVDAAQTITLVAGLPMALILAVMVLSLKKGLDQEFSSLENDS